MNNYVVVPDLYRYVRRLVINKNKTFVDKNVFGNSLLNKLYKKKENKSPNIGYAKHVKSKKVKKKKKYTRGLFTVKISSYFLLKVNINYNIIKN